MSYPYMSDPYRGPPASPFSGISTAYPYTPPNNKTKNALIMWQTKLPPRWHWEWTDPAILMKLITIREEGLTKNSKKMFLFKMKKADREEIESQIVQLKEGLAVLKANAIEKNAKADKITANIQKALREGYTALAPEKGKCYEWFNTFDIPGEDETKYIGECTDSRLHHNGQYGENPTHWVYRFEHLPKLSLSEPYDEPRKPTNYLKPVVCRMEGGRHRRKGTRRRRTNRAKTNKRVKVN